MIRGGISQPCLLSFFPQICAIADEDLYQFCCNISIMMEGSKNVSTVVLLSGWNGCSTRHSWKNLFPSKQPKIHCTILDRCGSTTFCHQIFKCLYKYRMFNVSSLAPLYILSKYFKLFQKDKGLVILILLWSRSLSKCLVRRLNMAVMYFHMQNSEIELDLVSTFIFGCFRLLEEGGTIFTFEGSKKKCSLKSVLRIHNPQFYWKVCTFNLSVNGW